jgi:hypothetical protein
MFGIDGWVLALIAFVLGYNLGAWSEGRRWREKGDHEYKNRMASGHYLYQVKRERENKGV